MCLISSIIEFLTKVNSKLHKSNNNFILYFISVNDLRATCEKSLKSLELPFWQTLKQKFEVPYLEVMNFRMKFCSQVFQKIDL